MILFRNFSSPLYSPLVFANLDESRLFFQFVKRCIKLYTTIYVISLSLWKPSNLVSMYIKCLEIIFTFVSHPPSIAAYLFPLSVYSVVVHVCAFWACFVLPLRESNFLVSVKRYEADMEHRLKRKYRRKFVVSVWNLHMYRLYRLCQVLFSFFFFLFF